MSDKKRKADDLVVTQTQSTDFDPDADYDFVTQ
jgi:hypothetical protein